MSREKNIPLAKEEADYRPGLDPDKVRDQVAYEHFTEKDRTSDAAVLSRVELKRRAVDEEALRSKIHPRFSLGLGNR
jgi:hypothetical protein